MYSEKMKDQRTPELSKKLTQGVEKRIRMFYFLEIEVI